MNLASVVREHANQHANKAAILCGEQSLSYAQLWQVIEGIALRLAEAGAGAGDRVGLAMKEHPLHLAAHYAVARLSAVIVPMDHRWTDHEKAAAAAAFDTKIVVDDGAGISGVETLALDESLLDTDVSTLGDIDETDCDLLISLSSGTTGKPKGALVTHRNLYERFVSQWHAIGYGANDCFALLTPFYFGAGRSFGMSLLAAGGTVRIAPPPLKPPQILNILSDATVTATFLPPTLLRRLFAFHEAGAPPLLANLDYLIVSGEPLYADEAHECLQKICPNLYSYYASSEGGGISVLRAEDFEEYAATVGKPTYKTDVEIVDNDDNELHVGEVGRLRYRGPGVATRYLDSDGSEHEAAVGGWFYPGDLAEKLDTGFIALRGRDKDVVIRGGINIYPAEIESALQQHPDVDEVAVAGVKDAARGEIVIAFVVGSANLSREQLADYSRSVLAPYKVPQEFRLLEELPKRSSGKIDKVALTQ
jgi:acyl-CoA synthetase (AMP-forming)/AMP-acid ligase II